MDGQFLTCTRQTGLTVASYRMDHAAAAANGAVAVPRLKQSYVWGLDVSGTYQGAGGAGGLLSETEWRQEMQTDPNTSIVTEVTTASTFMPAYDGNGNVMALVDTVGDISATYEYDPFGRPIRATGSMAQTNPFRFSTKFTDDETGLVYYGYRYYDAAQGRWLGRDPIGERGGPNLFGMCWNNLMLFIDDTGLQATIAPPRQITPKPWPPGVNPRPGFGPDGPGSGSTPGRPRPRPGSGRPRPGGGGIGGAADLIERYQVIKIVEEDPLDPMNLPLLEIYGGAPIQPTPVEPVEPVEEPAPEPGSDINKTLTEVQRESTKDGCCLIWYNHQKGGSTVHNDYAAYVSESMNRFLGGPLGSNLRYEVVVVPKLKDVKEKGLIPTRYDGGARFPDAQWVFEAKTGHGWLGTDPDKPEPWWTFQYPRLLAKSKDQLKVAESCKLTFWIAFKHDFARKSWERLVGDTHGRVFQP